MEAVTFIIPGRPFAKQRPRATRRGRVYTPEQTVSFERQVGQIAMQHFAAPLSGAVRLSVQAHFKPAASWSRKKVAEHLGRPHCQKPDADNLVKAIWDGLNRIAFADDSQIAECVVRKAWSDFEQTIVTVQPLMEWRSIGEIATQMVEVSR